MTQLARIEYPPTPLAAAQQPAATAARRAVATRSLTTHPARQPRRQRFRAFAAKPLGVITLGDLLQAFADSLIGKPSSRSRTLAAVKSLLADKRR